MKIFNLPLETKWKVISSVMLLIMCICSLFTFILIQHTNETLDRCIDKQVQSLRGIFTNLEFERNRICLIRTKNFSNYKQYPDREEVLQAFAARDLEELTRLSTPYYTRTQSENLSFSSMAWILPDNQNLLRVHDPQRSPNNVSSYRPDVVMTNKEQKAHTGYIVARSGLRYSVIEPVFYEGKYLGAIQFGMDEESILKSIEKQLPLIVGLVIPNETYSVVTNATVPSLNTGSHTVQAHDLTLFTENSSTIDWNLKRQQVLLQGKEHILVKALDLSDFSGHPQAQIFAALDISEYVNEAKTKILFTLLLGIFLTVASFLILYYSYGTLVENIVTLNRSLLQKSTEWKNTFDAMSDIVTVQDQNMIIVKANKAAHEFFQDEQESITGQKCFTVFRGSTTPCPGCPAFESLQDARNHSEIVTHNELGKTFHVASAPIIDQQGRIQNIIHTAKDITEQKRLEEELFQAHKMEAIGTLAGGIAHDFNNILTAIIGYSELAMLNIPPDSKANKDIDQVLRASRRATNLVHQILTFSRKKEQQKEALQPHLIIKEALKMMRSSLPTTIDIQENIDTSCGMILADPTGLHQIVVNLCTNALHAMEDQKGILRISLQGKVIDDTVAMETHGMSPGSFIVLEISDTGHGMDQATRERIFEPYFTTKKVNKGTGLGLAVIQGIITDYQGFIRVESEPGKGTVFYVHFPLLQEDFASVPEETQENGILPRGSERILVVDDERMIAQLHKYILEELGYTVYMTTDSLDALQKFKIDPDLFDLIITDQTMPGLTGSELAQKIHQINKKTPIILCTGYSSILSEEEALALNITAYARKPIKRATLAGIVREALDRNKS